MGLDTSHGCWHGSYGGFAAWRNDIARVIGWEVEGDARGNYVIPEGRIPDQAPPADEIVTTDGETYVVKWSESYPNGVYLGQWDKDPEDVLDVLMLHSDCEGIIPHRFCKPLAERLHEIAVLQEQHPSEDERYGNWHYDATIRFLTGLLNADRRGEDVDFR
jgi:hypothetical protein